MNCSYWQCMCAVWNYSQRHLACWMRGSQNLAVLALNPGQYNVLSGVVRLVGWASVPSYVTVSSALISPSTCLLFCIGIQGRHPYPSLQWLISLSCVSTNFWQEPVMWLSRSGLHTVYRSATIWTILPYLGSGAIINGWNKLPLDLWQYILWFYLVLWHIVSNVWGFLEPIEMIWHVVFQPFWDWWVFYFVAIKTVFSWQSSPQGVMLPWQALPRRIVKSSKNLIFTLESLRYHRSGNTNGVIGSAVDQTSPYEAGNYIHINAAGY